MEKDQMSALQKKFRFLLFCTFCAIVAASLAVTFSSLATDAPVPLKIEDAAKNVRDGVGDQGAKPEPTAETVKRAKKLVQQGNYLEAFNAYQKLLTNPKLPPREVATYLPIAINCLQRLNKTDQFDAFVESVIKAHEKEWRVLHAAANAYQRIRHQGYLVSGKYIRGHHRGGGKSINSFTRDRVRMLQLMEQAIPSALATAEKGNDKHDVGQFLMDYAQKWIYGAHGRNSWQLQMLTDLSKLPDYEDGYYRYSSPTKGAPVDEEDTPIYYASPRKFGDAKNDGERWRWCLTMAAEMGGNYPQQAGKVFADFLYQQFGVQTMNSYGRAFGRLQAASDDKNSMFALHTLTEKETLAKLATGVKRFELPKDQNFITLYKQLAYEGDEKIKYYQAAEQLASIYQNRRQYVQAAKIWKQLLDDLPSVSSYLRQRWQRNYDQIVLPWGTFEPQQGSTPSKTKPTVDYKFRNGGDVTLVAKKVKVKLLLDDVKAYIQKAADTKSRDNKFYQKARVSDIGYRLVRENETKYIGETVAEWKETYNPRDNHYDKRETITCKFDEPGAYLVSATMKDGNISRVVLWVADTAIVQKPVQNESFTYVADAVSGAPVDAAKLDFFGYQHHYSSGKRWITTKKFEAQTNEEGMAYISSSQQPTNHTWLITATKKDGRFAFLGFTNAWFGNWYDREYNATKTYWITDRPVYRPEQKVHYKFWVRHAQYDQDDNSQFAGKVFELRLNNPRGEQVFSKNVTCDKFGGIAGEYDLPDGAMLGVWRLSLRDPGNHNRYIGASNFRVEEYKKPEYEVVVDAPKEPVMLGEKITATISAKYFFGAPVTNAKVKYKVTRTKYSKEWYPIGEWDWFYGPGYWWFGYDYPWYPGWYKWGCIAPRPIWWHHRSHVPPEIVAEQECEIGEDGKVKVTFDTAIAKALHPDDNQQYSISVEVRDQSRRTILGSGNVLVAKQPFKVYAWGDRGYYRTGDTIETHFRAQTLDSKPVQGKGVVTLYEVRATAEGGVKEVKLLTKKVDTNPDGLSQMKFAASRPGQFRVAYNLTDSKKHTIEGAYVFTIRGEGGEKETGDFRFSAIELVPDKKEYAPGEKVKLQINADKKNGFVLFFAKPVNGCYQKPKLVHLKGKSNVELMEITKKDMPNTFVEAVIVADGRVQRTTKEIVVPPEKRILNVDIKPSKDRYKPGQAAKVQIKLTELDGTPYQGQAVVTIYDKSVEYIAQGGNPGDIKEFYWKWRRRHNPQGRNNLTKYVNILLKQGEQTLRPLGVFGASVADDFGMMDKVEARKNKKKGNGVAFGGMATPGAPMMSRAAAPMAAMPKSEAGPMPDMMMDSAASEADGGMAFADEKKDSGRRGGGAAPANQLVQATVRKNFADTALFKAAILTDKDGIAEVELDMPENLTTWKVKVWAMGQGTRVGQAAVEVITSKDLLIRLQAPRFFVQTDEVVLSAIVHNYLKTDKKTQVGIKLDGPLALIDEKTAKQNVTIKANGEKRIDWRVNVQNEGEVKITMSALTDEESDAMQMEYPCYIHGIFKQEARSGGIRPDEKESTCSFTVPGARRVEDSKLTLRFSPTLAGAMLDALPYLAEYPYGCTEQTLNRFLPSVITRKTLQDLGVDLKELQKKQTNLNAQELGDAKERAEQWKRWQRNPVFKEGQLDKIVKAGVKRLLSMQCADGGWGWFSGIGERSYPHTTAVVLRGLLKARESDVDVSDSAIQRGVAWLARYQDGEVKKLENALVKPKAVHPYKTSAGNLDALILMVLQQAKHKSAGMQKMTDFLYRDRTKLAVYSLAVYGIALSEGAGGGDKDKLAMVIRNIGQYVQQDDENQTAWLNLAGHSGYHWWYWYGSEWEAHAYYLKLLARTDPKGELAPRLVKYLLNNRKHATYWNSTRDTALCVEAFAEFIKASGEGKPNMTVKVFLGDKEVKSVKITPENLFTFDGTWEIEGADVKTGDQKIRIVREGTGPLYYNAYLQTFTLESFIRKAGLEVKVERAYYKLERVDATVAVSGGHGQAINQKIEKYKRIPLENLSEVTSGDLVEIELSIASKNDYEYLIFEDFKPAGFEPVEVRSGYNGNEMGAYVEFRDEKVAFFVQRLARGEHSVSYRMRAETPGKFSALPTRAYAMYAPELKANSDEIKLRVKDEEQHIAE